MILKQLTPMIAASWAHDNQGALYDWQLILGFLAWLIPHKKDRVMCSEVCAEMLGFDDAWRFDPCSLHAAVTGLGARPDVITATFGGAP